MTLAAMVSCQDGMSDTWSEAGVNDKGRFAIPAGTFVGLKSDCTIRLNIQRNRSGQLDANFGQGGIISGGQSRTVNFNTVE